MLTQINLKIKNSQNINCQRKYFALGRGPIYVTNDDTETFWTRQLVKFIYFE